MEHESSRESPSRDGSSLPGEWPSSSLGQAFSQIVHHLSGQESRRGQARNAALQDLSALLEATECDQLFEGSGASLGGMPEMLGKVAKALEKYAAPPKEQEGREDGYSAVAEKAAAVGLLFIKLLRKVESAKNSLVCLAWKRGLRHLAGPIYILPSHTACSNHGPGQGLRTLLERCSPYCFKLPNVVLWQDSCTEKMKMRKGDLLR